VLVENRINGRRLGTAQPFPLWRLHSGPQSSSVDQYSETPPEHLASTVAEAMRRSVVTRHCLSKKLDADMGRVPRAGCATRVAPTVPAGESMRRWAQGYPFQNGDSPAARTRGPRPDALRRGRKMGYRDVFLGSHGEGATEHRGTGIIGIIGSGPMPGYGPDAPALARRRKIAVPVRPDERPCAPSMLQLDSGAHVPVALS
jgi:hypothetical protein